MHDDHALSHEEHTGHGGHHVASPQLLLRTFGGLVFLTVLTVVLALAERAGYLPLGGMSVPVALAIAGAKAFLVAAFFMALKYDGGTNLISFIGSAVFLVIFLAFTYLDTGFRDTFEEESAVPVDILEAEALELQAEQERLLPAYEASQAALVQQADTLLFPNAPTAPGAAPAP